MIAELSRNRQVKDYLCSFFSIEENELIYAREHSLEAGLKAIAVPSNVGKMLYLLCRLQNPKKILEIGTLGGYSTLWLAKGMHPEGRLITLEREEKHIQIAREHFERAGFENRIELRQGEAEGLLKQMVAENEPPFDLIFIDADKENYPVYLDLTLALSRPGTLILSDNLIPKRGEILEPDPRDTEAVSIYDFNARMAAHPRLESMLFPTIVGENGRVDALGVALVHS